MLVNREISFIRESATTALTAPTSIANSDSISVRRPAVKSPSSADKDEWTALWCVVIAPNIIYRETTCWRLGECGLAQSRRRRAGLLRFGFAVQ